MPVAVGDPLPDVELLDSDERHVSLSSLAGQRTLLIFLRHLGCLPCREHLREALAAREQLGLRVACVTFSEPEMLAAFRRELGLSADVLLLGDPARRAYQAFGFERGSVARVWLDPRVWWRYAQLLARGRRPVAVHQDTLQLGGDVISDSSGRITWIYRSRGPEDRPGVEQIATLAGSAS
jgi:peroxiredoxin